MNQLARKFHLNTYIDVDISARLKAYAGIKRLTIAKTLELLLQDALENRVKVKDETIEFPLVDEAMETRITRAEKEIKENKYTKIKNKKELGKYLQSL